jgi:hypothetical protein
MSNGDRTAAHHFGIYIQKQELCLGFYQASKAGEGPIADAIGNRLPQNKISRHTVDGTELLPCVTGDSYWQRTEVRFGQRGGSTERQDDGCFIHHGFPMLMVGVPIATDGAAPDAEA